MAVKIRLARGGAKKRPHYRVVVANSDAPRDGSFIEKIGVYDPFVTDGNKFIVNTDRANYWLSVGAKPTEKLGKFFAKNTDITYSLRSSYKEDKASPRDGSQIDSSAKNTNS